MSKHTKEPWRIGLCGADAETFPIESGDGFVFITDAHPEDARRIVACVNACKGIQTEFLELGESEWVKALSDRNALRQQRDELLAALEKVESADLGDYDRETIEAAIAKVKP